MSTFFELLQSVISSDTKPKIILGDVNIDLLTSSNVRFSYESLLNSFGFGIFNRISAEMATRVTPNSATLIDHVLSNLHLDKLNQLIVNDTYLSDHRSLLVQLCDLGLNRATKSRFTTSTNFELIQNDLTALSQYNFDSFHDCLLNIIQKYTSRKLIRVSHPNSKPWFDQELINISKKRDFFYKLKNKYPQNSYITFKFNHFKKLFRLTIKHKKKSFYNKKLRLEGGDPRLFWSVVTEIIFNKIPDRVDNNLFLIHNQVEYTDPLAVSIMFNEYFSAVGTNSQAHFTPSNLMRSVGDDRTLKMFTLTTIEEVTELILSLGETAPGIDFVKASFLKKNVEFFSEFIYRMINDAFNSGKFPVSLKTARVSPIFKKGDKSDISNYRPISVSSVFSKVYELCIKRRLMEFLVKYRIISDRQFGFTSGSSTTSAVVSLLDSVFQRLETRQVTACLFIDIRKAFDCVNYDQLRIILSDYGIRESALNLISDFLTDRKQQVVVGDCMSPLLPLLSGIPQGSILGPILFLIYINEIFSLRLHGQLLLYADDSALIYSARSVDELNQFMREDICILIDFLKKINMQINFEKTKFMIFKYKQEYAYNKLLVDSFSILRVDGFDYLGLWIDHNLTWRPHSVLVLKKISNYAGIFWRLRRMVSIKTLLTVYFAYVQSHLSYMLPVWGASSDSIVREVQIIQSRILKCIFHKPLSFSSRALYTETIPSNILNFKSMADYEAIFFIFKLKHGLVKCNTSLQTNFEITGRVTRGSQLLRRGDFISSLGQRSILYRGITLFNNIPQSLKLISRPQVFKAELRNYLRLSSAF
jgi:hypothetical protein